jgi:SOS-response transcriptional repressor LexA
MKLNERIKQLRLERGLSQKQLAAAVGVKQSTISHWESGRQEPWPEKRKNLCEALGIAESELFGGASVKNALSVQKIPIISWVHANKFEQIDNPFPAGTADEYILSDIKGDHVFALRVQNSCMEPEFLEGDTIIVQPNVSVTSGDYIIVVDREANSATFKQLKEYGNKKILHPLNPKFKDIELDHKKQYVIVGKIVGKTKKYP